jgi:hypothetical protein
LNGNDKDLKYKKRKALEMIICTLREFQVTDRISINSSTEERFL